MIRRTSIFAVLGLLALAGVAQADKAVGGSGPPPEPATPKPVLYELKISIDAKAPHAQLTLPQDCIGPVDENAKRTSDARARGRTIMAGLAISAALVTLVFVRRSSRGRKMVVGLLAATVLLGSIGWATADIALPDAKPAQAAGLQVAVDVAADGKQVKLVLPAGAQAEFLQPAAGAK